jgi:NADH-quinone oxidoreductase subunit F
MGKKASFLPRGDMDKYLCCNADESEPGAFKDRELMQRNPHQLIEGIAIAALAAGAGHAFIFIRGEYDSQADVLEGVLRLAPYNAGGAPLFANAEGEIVHAELRDGWQAPVHQCDPR